FVWCPAEGDGCDGRASEPSDTGMTACLSCDNRSGVASTIEPLNHTVQGLEPRFVQGTPPIDLYVGPSRAVASCFLPYGPMTRPRPSAGVPAPTATTGHLCSVVTSILQLVWPPLERRSSICP